MHYSIPLQDIVKLSIVFSSMEAMRAENLIEDYEFSQATLEEIFCRLCRDQQNDDNTDDNTSGGSSNSEVAPDAQVLSHHTGIGVEQTEMRVIQHEGEGVQQGDATSHTGVRQGDATSHTGVQQGDASSDDDEDAPLLSN